jgi:hypothetical protein
MNEQDALLLASKHDMTIPQITGGLVSVVYFIKFLYRHGFSVESVYSGEDHETQARELREYLSGDASGHPWK